ncbi:MAG: hypothetical protein U0269_04645 [Polyangiales bacterium]
MRSFRKPESSAVPPRKLLTNDDVRRLPPARIETEQQACDRVVALLASIDLTNELASARWPKAVAIPGLARWNLLRARWWFVTTMGARGRPHRDEWTLDAIVDALSGELRWWRFSHRDDDEHQRLLNESIEREQRRTR